MCQYYKCSSNTDTSQHSLSLGGPAPTDTATHYKESEMSVWYLSLSFPSFVGLIGSFISQELTKIKEIVHLDLHLS